MCCDVLFLLFVKQKTAYEMRISDWSSDVCSSDLFPDGRRMDCEADGNCGYRPSSDGHNPSDSKGRRSASTHALPTARNGRGRPSRDGSRRTSDGGCKAPWQRRPCPWACRDARNWRLELHP